MKSGKQSTTHIVLPAFYGRLYLSSVWLYGSTVRILLHRTERFAVGEPHVSTIQSIGIHIIFGCREEHSIVPKKKKQR
jgi:hypothetical protein